MKNQFYLILALLFAVLLSGSGSWGLTESSEARYAEIAREMVASGDYLHPSLLGIHHYHKPPVTYQLTALGYQIFGINEFGARFFLAVALLLQVFFVYKIGRLLFKDEKKAIASALIYFSFPVVLIAARNLTTDAFLTTFILWALYFWLLRKQGRSVLFLYGFYLMLGLAMLTKGPVVLLPPVIFILFWKIINREKMKFTMHTFLGTLLFLVVSASWFVAVIIDKPILLDYFVKDQIVKRSLEAEKFHRSKPFWYYLAFAPLLGVPWLFFIGTDAVKNFKSIMNRRKNEMILLWSSLLLLLIFSLFSSKLILYILPIYPFMALLGGSLLERTPLKRLNIYTKIFAGLFLILFSGLLYLSFSEQFQFSFWYALPLCALLAAVGFYFLKMRNKDLLRPVYMGVWFSVFLLFTYALFGAQNDGVINSVKELSAFVKQEKQDVNNVVVYDYLLPSAAFYLGDRIVTVNEKNFKSQREVEFESDSLYKKNYIDLRQEGELKRFKDLMRQKDNVLILRKKKQLPDSLQYLLTNFSHSAERGKWRVYY
ncbi:MAG: glycosyltransferase family 39 protein [Salinimicrobium sp.]